ncbi:unnamed protein product [Closterium sp. Yama58-4]|nr:unnamed protein product [Closterium sp. Yama58-4]
MAHHGTGNPRYGGHSSQFGDTTLTKVFVGGLAWETQTETMRKYFEQFGEILEAVVITDRMTGRSKGYGFVTFSDPEAAQRACLDPSPVIDGRRANCNLASLGQKQRPQQPRGQQGGVPFGGYPPQHPYPMYPLQGYPMSPFGYPQQFQEGAGYGFPQGVFPPYGPQGFPAQPGMFVPPVGTATPGGMYPGYPPAAFGPTQAAQAAGGFPGGPSMMPSAPQPAGVAGVGVAAQPFGFQQMQGGQSQGFQGTGEQQQMGGASQLAGGPGAQPNPGAQEGSGAMPSQQQYGVPMQGGQSPYSGQHQGPTG